MQSKSEPVTVMGRGSQESFLAEMSFEASFDLVEGNEM